MRCWHQDLIPKLCRQHLLAMWRECLGMYKIIVDNRTDLSYWKHPATQEFVNDIPALWSRLYLVRKEMLKRGYHPKEMPIFVSNDHIRSLSVALWQTLDEQIAIIKSKKCKCKI